MTQKLFNVKNVVLIGMFSALAAVLETLQIPVPFAPPFYKLDFAELPVLVGAFAMGPVPAVPVSYTHLDVYKRQPQRRCWPGSRRN